ncbi:hypothetical protein [Streptomyces subrutilus]|uniref:hypothetical protein n=1 Tax=Streptomyces subrutilus TaxID=36818 RepID=UPI00114CE438|nr:hypothetical protein [Streptomyces subrutilus]
MRTGDGARVTVAGLMRAAFQPHQSGKAGGPLADAAAEGGEPEVASSASHRTVDFHDRSRKVEIIQCADRCCGTSNAPSADSPPRRRSGGTAACTTARLRG